jgi:5-methylcytosine-specific restriction endonuclease McrA
LIPVVRSPMPKALQKNSAKWLDKLKQQQLELQALRNDPNATDAQIGRVKKNIENAQTKYGHPHVKDELVKMFHGKCAYCESKITVVTYGAIEHFRPKSNYPDLTFEWNNLLLSCDVCNDVSHKATNFPLDINGEPLLIDPTDGVTDPNTHLNFAWDAIAGLASVYGRDERGKTVETIFDLNGMKGRKELIAYRSKYVKRLCALLRLAQTGDKEAITLLSESCDAGAEYSAFAIAHIQPHLP